jgi:hypothetical protein
MGENKKTVYFYLFLVDFIIAVQVAAVSAFPGGAINLGENWASQSFTIALSVAFLVFLIFSEIFVGMERVMGVIRPGLVFLVLGSSANFFLDGKEVVVIGETICGLGAGMVLAGQIGIIWHEDFGRMKRFSLAIMLAFIFGLIFGIDLIRFLSGPMLSELKITFLLSSIFPILVMLELENFFGWAGQVLAREKKRLGIWGIGYVANWLIDFGFNFILYPYVIWKLGILSGGFVMTILSFLLCYVIMIFYDWAKKDWLGIETIKQLKEYKGKSTVGRLAAWLMKKSDLVLLVVLSVKFDPFITTAYMRHGAHEYSGMTKRDWKIFMASLLVGNIYWTIVAFAGVSVIEYVGKYVF